MATLFKRLAKRRRTVTLSSGAHAYFDTLTASTYAFKSVSLRAQSGDSNAIDSYTSNPPNGEITYDASEDAARVAWPSTSKDINKQLNVPIGISSGSVLFVWDAKYSDGWRTTGDGGNVANVFTHKEWNIRMATDQKIYMETRFRSSSGLSAGLAGNNDFRSYDFSSLVAGRTNNTPVAPMGPGSDGTVDQALPANAWIRYIEHVRLNVPSSDATAFAEWESTNGVSMSTGNLYHIWSVWILTSSATYKRLRFVPIDDESPLGVTRDEIEVWNSEHNTSAGLPESTGAFRLTGSDGTVVPSTTKLTRDSDGHAYNLSTSGTISGGSVVLIGRATGENSGAAGNCSSGVSFTVSVPVAGLDAAAVSDRAFVGGQNNLSTTTYIWERNLVVLRDYPLPSPPEDDGIIFNAAGLG